MSYGCFVDIQQQDGALRRMHYENTAVETVNMVRWIGAMEQMNQKFRAAIVNENSTNKSDNVNDNSHNGA
jgi:hypothetical protein